MGMEGYDIFIPDYRGYGKTEGRVTSNAQLLSDAQRAYDHVKDHYEEKDIIVVGYSLGTGMASHVAMAPHKPRHLFLAAPYTSLTDVKDKYLWMFPDFLLKYRLSNEDHLDKVTAPITLMHGTADEIIDYDLGAALKQKYPRVEFVSKEGMSHRRLIFNIGGDMRRSLE